MVFDLGRQPFHQGTEVLQPDPFGAQEFVHALEVTKRLHRPAEDHTVETAEHTLHLIAVLGKKSFHDSLHHTQGIVLSSCAKAAARTGALACFRSLLPKTEQGHLFLWLRPKGRCLPTGLAGALASLSLGVKPMVEGEAR